MLLTSAEDIFKRRKEYVEDLLNLTDTSSVAEAESGDKEGNSCLTRGEATEVV